MTTIKTKIIRDDFLKETNNAVNLALKHELITIEQFMKILDEIKALQEKKTKITREIKKVEKSNKDIYSENVGMQIFNGGIIKGLKKALGIINESKKE